MIHKIRHMATRVGFKGILLLAMSVGSAEYLILILLNYFAVPQFYGNIIDALSITVWTVYVSRRLVLVPSLKAYDQENKLITSLMTEGLFVHNPEERITYFNNAARFVAKYSVSDYKNDPYFLKKITYVDIDGNKIAYENLPFKLALTTKRPVKNVVIGVTSKINPTLWIKVNSVPHFKAGTANEIDFVITTFTDISQDLLNQQALVELNSRFQTAAEAVGFGVWEWDLIKNHLVWDRIMYKIFDLDPHQFTNDYEAFEKSLLPEDAKVVQDLLQKTFAEKNPVFSSRFRVRSQGGEVKYVSALARCFYDTSGVPQKMIGYNWDVTSEEILNQERNLLLRWQNSILNGTRHLIISMDSDGLINLFNSGSEKILDFNHSQIVGKKYFFEILDSAQILKKIELEENLGPFDKVKCELMSYLYEKCQIAGADTSDWDLKNAHGQVIPIRFTITPVRNEFSDIIGFIAVGEDMSTEYELKENILKQQVVMASQVKLASLGEMAGGIAHEINSPLATIRGRASQLLRHVQTDHYDKENFHRFLELIVVTSDRIGKIISGLRTFARNADNDPFVPVSVNSVISDSLALCNEKFKMNEVKLNIGECAEVFISGRATQLSQVLINLIGNAYDAVSSLEEKWVRIDVQSSQKSILIRVVDSGKGVPKDVADKIMQPFFTTKEFGKGTGLGLSISKSIIDDHKGRLYIDHSHSNTCFVVELPLLSEGVAA